MIDFKILIKNTNNLLFFIIFLLTVVCVLSGLIRQDKFFDDPGVGWHLRDGENIVETLKVPYEDNFLSVKRNWISDQWLSDIICYFVYSIGGFRLVFSFFLFLYLFFVVLFYNIFLAKKYNDPISSCLVSIIPLAYCTMHFILRPVFFSICLFIIFLYLFEDFKKQQVSYKKINIKFFILFLFWANIHPSFVFGFFIWGVYCLEQFFKNYRHFEYKKYFITSLCIGGATLLNPYFISLHESILFLGTNKYFMNLNSEWKSISPLSLQGGIVTCAMIIVFLFYIFNKEIRKKIGITYFVSACILYFYAMSHVRGMTYFTLILGVILSPCISKIISLRNINKLYILRVLPEVKSNLKKYISFKLFFLIICIFFLFFQYKIFKKDFLHSHKQAFPYKIARYVNFKKLSGNIIASPNYGGFIIWNMRNLKPVMDDRNTLLGENAYRSFFKAFDSEKDLRSYSKNVNARYLLVGKKDKDNMYNQIKSFDILKKVFEDRKFVLFLIKNEDKNKVMKNGKSL